MFPPARSELVVYALWLSPAILGATLNWAWWIPFALLVPGSLLWRRAIRAAAVVRDPRMPRHLTGTDEVPFMIAGVVVGFALVKVGSDRYAGLASVVAWIAVLLPVQRAIWRRVDREERQLLTQFDADGAARASAR